MVHGNEKDFFFFRDLISGSYAKSKLKFEVVGVDLVKPSAAHGRFEAAKQRLRALRESKKGAESEMESVDVEERLVFHSCPPDVVPLICANTLRPSLCAKCKKGRECDDPGLCCVVVRAFVFCCVLLLLTFASGVGFFGAHTKGVYVSKHADYTFYYVRSNEVKEGDTGSTIVLKCVTGRRKHFREMVRCLFFGCFLLFACFCCLMFAVPCYESVSDIDNECNTTYNTTTHVSPAASIPRPATTATSRPTTSSSSCSTPTRSCLSTWSIGRPSPARAPTSCTKPET